MVIDPETFLENLFSILRFEAERNVDQLRKRVDPDKWATEPAVVNAFYNPNKNDIGEARRLKLYTGPIGYNDSVGKPKKSHCK